MTEQKIKFENLRDEELALRVLRVLDSTPAMSQRDLAAQSGMSLGSLNYCLRALMAKGLVKMQNFARSNNKLGYAYVLTPKGFAEKAEMTRRFLKYKQQEYEALIMEIEALKREIGEDGKEDHKRANA